MAVLDFLPDGVSRFGESTSACTYSNWIGVTAMPVAGSTTFGLTSSGSPPSASGLLVLSSAPLPGALPLLGVDVWIDPAAIVLSVPVVSDAVGWCAVDFPLPVSSGGVSGFFQFLWVNPAACGGAATLGSSSALVVTVQ